MLARLGLDIGLTGLMLALFSFGLTGLALHEWLGLALCIVLPVHMLVSWSWLAATTGRLFGTLPWKTRLTYLLNMAFFAALVVVTVTGLVISEAIAPNWLPMTGSRGFWRVLHTTSSNACLVLMGLHIAVYWRTLVNVVQRGFGWIATRGTSAESRSSRLGQRARAA